MQPRIIAVSDIHGNSQSLDGILVAINPAAQDTLVFLGDYVDSGPDSKGVLDRLIDLRSRFQVVTLMGNHEEMMLGTKRADPICGFG